MRPLPKLILTVALMAAGFGVWAGGMVLWDTDRPLGAPKRWEYKAASVAALVLFVAGMSCTAIPLPAKPRGPSEGDEGGAEGPHYAGRTWVFLRFTPRGGALRMQFPERCACCGSGRVDWGKPLTEHQDRAGGAASVVIDLAGLRAAGALIEGLSARGANLLPLCDRCFRGGRWRAAGVQILPALWVAITASILVPVLWTKGPLWVVPIASAVVGASFLLLFRWVFARTACSYGVRRAFESRTGALSFEARHPVFVDELVALNQEGAVIEADWDALDEARVDHTTWSQGGPS